MIKRLLSAQTKYITGAAVILGAASLLSRLMGVIRDRIFAHYFGAGDVLDAYYAAFRVPDLVYNLLIVGALSAGFIPVFLEYFDNKKKEEAWHITNSILNITLIIIIAACALLALFTPQLMPYVVPGFAGEKLQLTITLTRIMFLSPVLLGVSSIVSGVLQSTKSFAVYSLSPIMYNLGIIIGAVVFVPRIGVMGLAVGVVLGALLHLLIQLPTLHIRGFRYRFTLDWHHPGVKKIAKLMIPRTLGLATHQLNLTAITVIASTIGAGSIAVFHFANNLQYVPIGIIGISFAVAAFPSLSSAAATKNTEELIRQLTSTIRQILFFILPLTVIFLLLRAQIVRVILGTGAFDWADTQRTANALGFFSLSLFAQSLIPLLARGFYAIQDTWTPFLTSFIALLATVAGSILLKDTYGIAGIALAYSLAAVLQFALLWVVLRNKLGTLKEASMLHSLYKMSVAIVLMAVTVQSLKGVIAPLVSMERFWGIFTQGVVAGLLGVAVYLLVLHLLKLEEMDRLRASLKRRFLNIKRVPAGVRENEEL